MDWNLKAPVWDFTEFPQGTIPSIDGSSSFGNSTMAEGDFSVDLKLGQVSSAVKETDASKKISVPAASTKRARAVNSVGQAVSCLVDGCYADLSNCREYHRRHKVCELHSKTAEVTIAGNKQRFCQQCSRFHSLEEFDEGKRSCRKRLEGHNRRRRKPQPDPLIRPVNCLSNYQGSRFPAFSNSNIYPSAALGNPTWIGVDSRGSEVSALYSHRQQMHFHNIPNLLPGPPGSSSIPSSISMYGGGGGGGAKPFALLQASQAVTRVTALSASGSSSNSNMFCDGLSLQVRDSDCALSLLSSPQMQTPGINSSVQPNSSSHGMVPVDSVLVSATDHHCSGMFHIGSDATQQSSQPLPFHWD